MLHSSISMNCRGFASMVEKTTERKSFSIRTCVTNSYAYDMRISEAAGTTTSCASVLLSGLGGGRILCGRIWDAGGWGYRGVRICGNICLDVLHDERDSPVRGIQRVLPNS